MGHIAVEISHLWGLAEELKRIKIRPIIELPYIQSGGKKNWTTPLHKEAQTLHI